MRLYSLAEATAVDDAVHGHFDPAADGGFDFPGPLADRLHAIHVGGQRQWETAIERQRRLLSEESARRQSPEALYEAVSRLVTAAEAVQRPEPAQEAAGSGAAEPAGEPDAPKPRSRKGAPARGAAPPA